MLLWYEKIPQRDRFIYCDEREFSLSVRDLKTNRSIYTSFPSETGNLTISFILLVRKRNKKKYIVNINFWGTLEELSRIYVYTPRGYSLLHFLRNSFQSVSRESGWLSPDNIIVNAKLLIGLHRGQDPGKVNRRLGRCGWTRRNKPREGDAAQLMDEMPAR